MSAHHKFKTDILVTIAGVEHEWPAVIIYARHKGFAGDRTDPPDPASVEIVSIKMLGNHGAQISLPAAIEDKFNDDADITAMLLEDWRDDEIAEAEYRAKARAELLAEDCR